MKVWIAGTGMEGRNTITGECEKAVAASDILIGAGRVLEAFADSGKQLYTTWDTSETVRIISENPDKNITVLMSGDCGFFSGAKKLSEMLGSRAEVICGISSPAYFCSKTGHSYEKMRFVSLHGRDDNIAVNVLMNRYCFFLLGGEITPADICRRLCTFGMGNVKIYIGENLGYENEKISSGTADKLSSYEADKLCVMITDNPGCLRFIPSGISDDEFIRKSVPMTKSEVRASAVSKLNICSDDICLDIGCGTGSVSVEMAFRCPEGRVCSFDIKEEAAELTAQNSRKFGLDNIFTETGDAAELLKLHTELRPDKVFIGGSGGRLAEIINLLFERNPEVKTVITAVTLETLNLASKALEAAGASAEITQIAVTRVEKSGKSSMLRAQNPVFIICGEKR